MNLFGKLAKTLALLLALISTSALADNLPEAPKPKHEAVKFIASALYFSGADTLQIIGQRHGAALCRMEERRNGTPQLWGTSKATGLPPRDKLVFGIGGGALATATVLELTGHKKAAKSLLIYGGTLLYGVGGATYWAGCN